MQGTKEEIEADVRCNAAATKRVEQLRTAPRQASDARRAWRKMNDAQRREFMAWLTEDEVGAFKPIKLGSVC